MTGLMLGILLAPAGRAVAASGPAALKAVTVSNGPAGTELVIHVSGTYSYKTLQAVPGTLFVDLTGAKVEGAARTQQWTNPVLAGYKLISYQDSTGKSIIRVLVQQKQNDQFVVHTDDAGLHIVYAASALAKSEPRVTTISAPELALAAPITPVAPSPAQPARTIASNVPAVVQAVPEASAKILISNVSIEKQDAGKLLVNVATSATATYRVMTLANPQRLVVDIDGLRQASAPKSYSVEADVLKDVRVGQFRAKDPSVVRVVADLNGNPVFDVHAIPAGVQIELRPRGADNSKPVAVRQPAAVKAPASTPIAAVAAPVAMPVPVATKIEDAKSSTAPVVVAATKPIQPPAKSASEPVAAPKSALVSMVAKSAPAPKPVEVAVTQPAVVPAVRVESREEVKPEVHSTLPALAVSPQTLAAPAPAPATVTPEALRADRAAMTLYGSRDEAAQGAVPSFVDTPPAESRPNYSGETISLNLKDVDLKDFFRLIHEISGLNIILDPNVQGSVTLVLDSVPWDQALDIVLKNNRLGKVMEGNVLRIAKIETLTAEQEVVTKLASARIDAAPLVTIFRPINYAKATDIATLLKTWSGGGALSRRGTVLVDVRGNTLIVSDVESHIPILEGIISKLDKKAKQVSIEARVVLATADFTRTLSSSLLGGFHNNATSAASTTGSNTSAISIPTPSPSAPFPITSATNAAASGFGVASIVNVGANYFIEAAISAAEERDQAKTISRPSIVTQNNVQGMVMQGVQVPIQTSINNTISVQYENATLQLTVTPQVTDDNNIFLTIMVNNASVGAVISGAGPSINTQQATTSVLVPDGGTVVFGGITVTTRSKAATYIPVLGNIPLLGHLFKTSNSSDADQELLFFVTPKIIPG